MGFKPRSPGSAIRTLRAGLRAFALGLPEATEDHPWGESVAKVRGKVFVFLGHERPGELGFSVKLPQSGAGVLAMPFATPTGYGLGKAGWVSITCTDEDALPLELLQSWVVESYRAVAPKRVAALLDE